PSSTLFPYTTLFRSHWVTSGGFPHFRQQRYRGHGDDAAGDVDEVVVHVVADEELGEGEGTAGDEEGGPDFPDAAPGAAFHADLRSEEHTSELQSLAY